MCVRIRFTTASARPLYDDASGTITLPASVRNAHAVTALRAVLSELHVEQPEFGALCWCGAPVDLTPRVPEQRRSEQVVSYGA